MENEAKVSLLKNRQYLYLISSQIVSSLGDWLDLLALLALVALKWEASPFEMALIGVCSLAPMVVFGPFAGVLADKFDRKKMMIISDVLRCIVVIGFVFATAMWQLYLLLILKSIFAALFIPAKNGKLKEIVPDEQMQPAMAISGMIDSGSKIIGPMVSGLLVSLIGIQWAFYLDAASFILSALLLIGVPGSVIIKNRISDVKIQEKKSMINEVKEGISVIKAIPIVLYGLIVLSLAFFVIQIADTQIMVLLRMVEGINVTDIAGYSIALNGLGMLVMAMILSKKEIRSTGAYMGIGITVLGLTFLMGALAVNLPLIWFMVMFPFFFLLSGFACNAVFIPFNISVQKNTPVEYTGRVFGTINSMVTLASLIGMVGGGIIAEIFGVVLAYAISGSLLIVVGIGVFILRNKLEGRVSVAEGERRLQGETTA